MYTTNPQHFIYSQTIRIVLQQITCELSYKRVRATKAQIATKIVQSKYELRMKWAPKNSKSDINKTIALEHIN